MATDFGALMEEEKEKEIVRIFVGGLGESVNGDELRRMFELSGGAVESLDFVRSKNRSFAYVDFSPSSEKSLSKLFAKYNGCVWKGGKLKLEKAKEHYLKRLAREWTEVSAEKANANAEITEDSSEKISQNLLPPENRDIRIFFPRLSKVKALPFNGTGKHKYSFQRIDVSLPPKYFCDCEEHSGPAGEEKRVFRVEAESGGVNQEEVNTMNKVMNNLFQKQIRDSVDVHNNDEAVDDDDDDLVINFATKGNNEVTLLERQQVNRISQSQLKRGSQEQKSKRVRSQGDDFEPQNRKKKPLSDERKIWDEFKPDVSASHGDLYTNPDESRKLAVEVKRIEPESSTRRSNNAHVSWSQKSSWKKLVGDKGNSTFSIASTVEVEPRLDCPKNSERDVIASTEKDELRSDSSNVMDSDSENENLVEEGEFEGTEMGTEGSVEARPSEQNVVSSQPKRGALWMQKSSWTQLVGENSSFSISQPFPCSTSGQKVLEKPKDADVPSSVDGKSIEIGNTGNDGADVSRTEVDVLRSTIKDDGKAILGNTESLKSVSEESCDGEIMRIAPVRVEVSETCTFMRSAASLKEWAKTKAALSGSVKKKK